MTAKQDEIPYDQLERMFHEPNRLAILSALCAAAEGLTFSALKQQCNLTDGNLNRHLKVLKETGAICLKKEFVDDKPRTTVFISQTGLVRFQQYLGALQQVLNAARKALPAQKEERAPAAAMLKLRPT